MVVKVSKSEIDIPRVASATQALRERERMVFTTALPEAEEAIIPQEYLIAEGTTRGQGKARVIRTQRFIEGKTFKELGFRRIMNLPQKEIDTLKAILKSSMTCFLKHGFNYDLFGSDEKDEQRKSNLSRPKYRS